MINKTKIRRELIKTLYKLGFSGGKFCNGTVIAERIKSAILEKSPLAVGRLGLSEINGFLMYNGDSHPKYTKLDPAYIKQGMLVNVGFYPCDDDFYKKWASQYQEMMQEMDLFSVYYNKNELYFFRRYFKKSFQMCNSAVVHPMLEGMDWMQACASKKVLVITSNVETIKTQLAKKDLVWGGCLFSLPDAEYEVIRSPFSPYVDPNNKTESSTEMMKLLKSKIDDSGCDVLLAAAGGYSNELVLYARELGKVGVNMGGSIDPLFGITTKRYAEGNNRMPNSFINEHWIKPMEQDKPENASKVEDGCYW